MVSLIISDFWIWFWCSKEPFLIPLLDWSRDKGVPREVLYGYQYCVSTRKVLSVTCKKYPDLVLNVHKYWYFMWKFQPPSDQVNCYNKKSQGNYFQIFIWNLWNFFQQLIRCQSVRWHFSHRTPSSVIDGPRGYLNVFNYSWYLEVLFRWGKNLKPVINAISELIFPHNFTIWASTIYKLGV